jgi:HK97 family phage portal protein
MSTIITGPGIDNSTERRSIEDPTKPLNMSQLAELYAGGPGRRNVTPRRAMRIGAVWACVGILADTIARIPIHVYRRREGGRDRVSDHPVSALLSLRPNPENSPYTLKSSLVANRALWGRGHAEIVRNARGVVQQIIPIETERVRLARTNGQLVYEVRRSSDVVTLLPSNIIHVPGLSFDGFEDLSVIGHMRRSLGSAESVEEAGTKVMENGMKPSGVLKHPGKLSDQAHARLRTSFAETYGGAENAGKVVILEEGMEWMSQGSMSFVDAQFIEQRQFGVEDIARMFRVPPHKIGHLARSTNNNIEQQSLDFLGDTLDPLLVAIEEELNWKLLTEEERAAGLYIEAVRQAVVQMDAATRGAMYERMVRVGAMSPDQVAARENLPALPDRRGTVYTQAANQQPMPTPQQADQLVVARIAAGAKSPANPSADPASPSVQDPANDAKT